jgi:predicted Zn-dependent peptidase
MKPKFYRKVLKNGMTVLFEKRKLPVVSISFSVKAGGINENIKEKGIFHFIEHLLYKGTNKRNAKQIAEEIEKRGGELNGFTDETVTSFWCSIPSKFLYVALDVLSDMVKNPKFDSKEMSKERKVIFEEIKLRKDNPSTYVIDKINGLLYDGTLGKDLIGTEETMNSIGRKEIVEKFQKTYTSNNLILTVVGNANFKEIVNFAEKNFSNQKGEILEQPISLKNGERMEKREGIDQANLIFAYHLPLEKRKLFAGIILTTLMAEGMSSRLFSEIREKRNLAYAVKGDSAIHKKYAHNLIYVGTSKENVEKVKKLILKEFEKVSRKLEEKELFKIKDQIVGNYYLSQESSQSQMVNLIYEELKGNAKTFYEFEKEIRKVRLEEVKKLAKDALNKHSFLALVPK